MKGSALALVGSLTWQSVGAQEAPLFTCEIERHIMLFEPGQPSRETGMTVLFRGFVIDFATGAFRRRGRDDGKPSIFTQWTVVQKGTLRSEFPGDDWVAEFNDYHSGGRQTLRVRTPKEQDARFVLFDNYGTAFVGACN